MDFTSATENISAGSVEETRIAIEDPQTNGDLVASLKDKLDSAPHWITRDSCIFRAPVGLRKVNEDAFTPQIVSIGPFHRKLERCKAMNNKKCHYLKALLSRGTSITLLEDCVNKLKELEKSARACYAEPIDLTSDEFVEMMLLDGCFIIELLLRNLERNGSLSEDYDPLFSAFYLRSAIRDDLLLLENQLPFHVLSSLFELISNTTSIPQGVTTSFQLALFYFWCNNKITEGKPLFVPESPMHLLDLALKQYKCTPKPKTKIETEPEPKSETETEPEPESELVLIPNATRLKEAGVKFVPAEKPTRLLDIKFEKGVLKIPILTVEDMTEPLFRNLIAFEQCYSDSTPIANYIGFMDWLIDTAEDVSLLRRKRIIRNWLGDDKEVSDLFNKLGTNVTSSSSPFYDDLYKRLNEYYEARWPRWTAKLKQDYFHNPWSTIAFIAAGIILICTVAQVFLSIIWH